MATQNNKHLPQALGHFNMELFYFSSILEIFRENSPQIDHTSVNYLTKIVKIINDLLKEKELVRVYKSQAFSPDDFDGVTLQRTLLCHTCNEKVPFLWTNFQEHAKECEKLPPGRPIAKKQHIPVLPVRPDHSNKAANQGAQPTPSTSRGTKEVGRVMGQPSYVTKDFDASEDDSTSDSSSSEEKGKRIVKQKKKELKALRKIIKAKKKEKKRAAVYNATFTLKKKTNVLLDMVPETMSQNVAIGEKIINLPFYKEITDDLENNLREEFPEVKVYIFGSRKTGLGTYAGDLDLFVDVNNHYSAPLKSKEQSAEIIEKVHNVLSQQPNTQWDKFTSILARTPILKTYNKAHKISCDLSFCNGLSHINTSLIRYLLTLQPDCHRVACFVKTWYKTVFIAKYEVNKVSSYMITLLVIFYMQTLKLLPPICQLQDTEEKSLMIGDWQGDFTKPTLAELNIETSNDAKKLLAGFFEYYGTFPYDTQIICPLLGHPIERSLFATPELLPNEMIRYKEYVQKTRRSPPSPEQVMEFLAIDTDMCVQDPLELCHNVAKGINLPVFLKFIKTSMLSAMKLRSLGYMKGK